MRPNKRLKELYTAKTATGRSKRSKEKYYYPREPLNDKEMAEKTLTLISIE